MDTNTLKKSKNLLLSNKKTTPKPSNKTTPKPSNKPTSKPVKKTKPKPSNKPTPKPVKKTTPKKVKKTTPKKEKKTTIIIEDEGSEDNLKIENKAVYLFTLRTCPYCQEIKFDWEQAKKENPTTQVYEVHAQMLNRYPIFEDMVKSYPTILRYDNRRFRVFENSRTIDNFSLFMKK